MKIRFDMIGLFVQDLTLMVEFYRDVMGLSITWDGSGPYAEFEHEGIRFSMYQRQGLEGLLGQKATFPSGVNGTFELSINVGTKDCVDKAYENVLAGGATSIYPPRDELWKMRSAMVTDPEGNLIEIASDFWD